MKNSNPIPVSEMVVNHLNIFDLFFDYWNVKNTDIDEEQDSFFKEIIIISKLETIWRNNHCSLDELRKIFSKIDEDDRNLDPNNFFEGKEIAYIEHIKSWYLLNNVFA